MGLNKLVRFSVKIVLSGAFALALSACGGGGASPSGDVGRMVDVHQALQIVDPNVAVTSASVSAQSITIGTMYLETQLAPITIAGVTEQASDVSVKGLDVYISYSSVDYGTTVIKMGAVEHVQPYNCDNPLTLTHVEFCLNLMGSLSFPTADIFTTASDGSNLYAGGSTLMEDAYPYFARLFKVSLDASKNPVAITKTAVLNSYATTGIAVVGTSSVLATFGTSLTDPTKIGGLASLNASTLTVTNTQNMYDARAVGVYQGTAASAYVAMGALNGTGSANIVKYNADASGTAALTIPATGNTIAQSKSSLQVGNTLLLQSLGDQGFKVMCKATGATLATIPRVTVAGIAAGASVTNSVVAAPGYIFAADGEAGVFVYTFQKSSIFNSSYCQGVSVVLLGRLSLSSTSYVPLALSANSVTYQPMYNALNVITSKMIMVASGNTGLSLINITDITVNTGDVDDF